MRAGTLKEDYLIKYLQRTTGQLRVEKVTAITFSKNARNGFGCDRNLPARAAKPRESFSCETISDAPRISEFAEKQ